MFGQFLANHISPRSKAAPKTTGKATRRNQCDLIVKKIKLGETILCVLKDEYPHALQEGSDGETRATFPHRFWRYFIESHLDLQYTNQQRLRCFRAAMFVIDRYNRGLHTSTAMRDGARSSAKRHKGGEYNAAKARGIGFALLQIFVDEFQALRSRTDSKMLLERARELRMQLLGSGYTEHQLPKLDGNAGKVWLQRWRKEHSISMKACGMQLKVSWSKVLRRCQVLLTNIFRVRAFWKHCHPDHELKFISADQKPSWFNNSGSFGTFGIRGDKAPSVRENFAKTRERYSLFTFVESSSEYQPGSAFAPPPLFILFKGKKNGRIKQNILEKTDLPDWLTIQVQECGSYREEDVIEALAKVLPICTATSESMVVLLDWYSAHRSERVVDFIEGRGHVVLFHGGGCTPFTQVNDTHLHALLQRYLVQLENQLTHAMRTDMHLNYQRGVPTLHRYQICEIASTAWKMIPHGDIARTGYKQTGPLMPAVGPIRCCDVYKDLQSVLSIIDPPQGEQEVGQRLRDDAEAFVRSGIPHKWSNWTHVKRLIVEQDDEENPLVEGLEGMGYDFGGDSDDDNDGGGYMDGSDDASGDDDDDDDGAGGGGGGGGDDSAVVDSKAHPSTASSASSGSGHALTEADVKRAREVLLMDARHRKDDVALRRLLRQRDHEYKAKKDADTDVARTLHVIAKEAADATRKKREQARKEQQQARLDVAKAEQLKAEAEARQAEIRLQILRENMRCRQEELERKQAEAQWKTTQTWLQTEYPCQLARRLVDEWTHDKKIDFKAKLKSLSQANWFRYAPRMPVLWNAEKHLLVKYATIIPFDGTLPRTVRCSPNFDSYLEEVAPTKTIGGSKDPIKALSILLDAAAPGSSRYVFILSRSLLRYLHMNDYVLDKTFVFCIVALSKWLGDVKFPQGIFNWPPDVQTGMLSTAASSSSGAVGATAPAISS